MRHCNCCLCELRPFVHFRFAYAVFCLLNGVGADDAEDDGGFSFCVYFGETGIGIVADEVEVNCFTADDDAERDDGVEWFGFDEFSGCIDQFETAGHAKCLYGFDLESLEFGDGVVEQLIAEFVVECWEYDGDFELAAVFDQGGAGVLHGFRESFVRAKIGRWFAFLCGRAVDRGSAR